MTNSDSSKQRRHGAVFSYDVVTREVEIAEQTIKVEALADFPRAIDEMFEYLQKTGRSEFLTQLCPYFGEVWPAAVGLCEYLAALKISWQGVRVLELGCGLAIPSLYLAKHGAQVIASDCHPDVKAFLDVALQLNAPVSVDYVACDWRKENPFASRFEWVVASDVLYDADLPRDLARRMLEFVEPGGRMVLADPGRAYLQDFVSELQMQGAAPQHDIRRIQSASCEQKEIFLISCNF